MGVLDGLKILDFSALLPGPYATLVMADMGAEVVRVSSKTRIDISLDKPPRIEGSSVNALAATLGRNKKSIALNLKKEDAKNIVKRLVKEYDIVIDQFRPGVMDKLGLGYEELKKSNPALIYCALTGYGQTGPLCLRAGHDINYLAQSGIIGYSGRKGEIPSLYGMQIADLAGGSMNVIVGVLAAVIYRNNTGKGQYIDVSMLDGAMAYSIGVSANALYAGQIPTPASERTSGKGVYDFYETKDGKYLSVGCLEPKFFKQFCEALDIPEFIEGGSTPENADELKKTVSKKLKTKTRDEWVQIFGKLDACVEPVLSYDEMLKSKETAARGMIVQVPMADNPDVRVPQLATPLRFSEAPNEYKHSGCPVGWNTKEILLEAGFTDDEIREFDKIGVLE